MMKRLSLLSLIVCLAIAGCTTPKNETVTPSQTGESPQIEKTESAPLNPDEIFAVNLRQTQQHGKVQVELVRVLVGQKGAIDPKHPQLKAQDTDALSAQSADKEEVVGAITFKITNNTDKTIAIFPNNWLVAVGGKQFSLQNAFLERKTSGDDFTGDVLPGVTAVFSVPFSLKNLTVPEVKNMSVSLGSAYEKKAEGYVAATEDFLFKLDLSQHSFEQFPEEYRS